MMFLFYIFVWLLCGCISVFIAQSHFTHKDETIEKITMFTIIVYGTFSLLFYITVIISILIGNWFLNNKEKQ